MSANNGREYPMLSENVTQSQQEIVRNNEIEVPIRVFDGFAVLSILKTVADAAAILALSSNNFNAGLVTASIGLGIAVVLRFIGNNLMKADLLPSGIEISPFSFKALINTVFGTRLGYKGHYERLRSEFAKDTVIEAEEVGDTYTPGAIPPPPTLYGGTETLKVGPRTLTAMAEVIQQGFVFYPLLILFLEFGFNEGDVEFSQILLFSGLVNFAHMLTWIVSPLLNVSYGYVYLTTWLSFAIPFLAVISLSVSFEEFIPDSYYTRKEIYAYVKTVSVLFFGFIGLPVYNSNIHKMLSNPSYRVAGRPALLYFMMVISGAWFAFDLVALFIVLISEETFVFDNAQIVDESSTARLKSIVLANIAVTAWTIIVGHVESITVETEMKDK